MSTHRVGRASSPDTPDEANGINASTKSWKRSILQPSNYKRHLPHIEQPGATYFTTSCTKQKLILGPEARTLVMSALRFHDGTKYVLDAAVIMPDHFHTLLRPLQKTDGAHYSLSEIFHSIKSYTAKQILSLSPTPPMSGGRITDDPARPTRRITWQDENWDHLIRSDKDHIEKLRYIADNPIKAGLIADGAAYPWLYLAQ